MFEHASFVPPHVTPPDPFAVKVVALVFSMFLSVVLMLFIGFMGIEFLADMLGQPLTLGTQVPSHDIYPLTEQDSITLLESPYELITPKHHTQMLGPEVVVIYTHRVQEDWHAMPPDLLVDGTAHPWEIQFSDKTWFTRLQLQAGLHHVQVGKTEAEFFVETVDSSLRSPEEWAWNRPHPDTNKIDRCYDCHEISVQSMDPLATSHDLTLGVWKGAESCFACHEREEHALRHAALKSTANRCFWCHSMH